MNAFLFALLTSTSLVAGDISVTQGPTVNDLVSTLLSGAAGITVTNFWLAGDPMCSGIFTDGASAVSNADFLDAGIILSTGFPNSLHMQGSAANKCHSTGGDADLNVMTGLVTHDACVLNIEFIVDDILKTPYMTFKYLFGSDDYPYWNANYLDAFALYLNGQNLAFIPGTATPVSTKNVNNNVNSQFFINNVNGAYPGFGADGFTGTFAAMGEIVADTNTLKLAIADAGDCTFDSWVLLEADSLQVISPPDVTMDPHFKTWGGEMFDYMGECDVALLDSPEFANGLGLHIDVRSTIRYDYSFIESAVLQIGEDTLEVASFGDFALNAVDTPKLDNASLAGHELHYKQVNKKISTFDVVLSPTTNITISTYKDMVNVRVSGSKVILGASLGIMGSSLTGDMMSRDGKLMRASSQDAINAYGQEWQVAADEPMRFRTARSPQASEGEKCILPGVTAQQSLRRRLEGGSISLEQAKSACAGLSGVRMDACVGDVLALQDLEAAQAGAY